MPLVSKTIVAFIVAYIIVLLMMYMLQRSLMYYPFKEMESPAYYGLSGAEEVFFEASDGVKISAWFKTAEAGRSYVLFLHGNGGNLGFRADKFAKIIGGGYGLMALSYRGFGHSEGEPTAEGIIKDADAALNFLKKQGINANDIIVYGESLGSGPAVHLAANNNIKLLALEAPFTSIAARAQEIYFFLPAKWMIRDNFDNLANINKIKAPVIIFHGADDMIIPSRHGQELFNNIISRKKIVIIPNAGHNNIAFETIMQEISGFIAE